tara:strand:- start:375 stop:851 length:477 start_codon:yes stop_codon:yes gene_type:complete
MRPSFQLRPMSGEDHSTVREVYIDAIESEGPKFYSNNQIQAWKSLAWLPGILDKPLREGKGWVTFQNNEIEAFAVRYPKNRLALIYCRGRSFRSGHGTALLKQLEADAMEDDQSKLVTEASVFGRRLFLRCGWVIKSPEKIKIGGVNFYRYLMEKELR